MGIYVKFTKTTHQIWSCHVILASNSENFYFSLNSVLNFSKSYQIWGKLAQEQKRLQSKKYWEWEHPPPPSAYRVNSHCCSFIKTNLRKINYKGLSKHLEVCLQQVFGLLHNIAVSLKSIRPNIKLK